jgi:hypothetical protein
MVTTTVKVLPLGNSWRRPGLALNDLALRSRHSSWIRLSHVGARSSQTLTFERHGCYPPGECVLHAQFQLFLPQSYPDIMVAEKNPKRSRRPARRQEKNPQLTGAHYRQQIEQDHRSTKITGSPATDQSVEYAWKKWEAFCECIEHPDPLELVKVSTQMTIRQFMHWYLDKHNVGKSDAFYVRMRFWRMACARKLLKSLDFAIRQDMKFVSRQLFPSLLLLSLIHAFPVHQRDPHPRLRAGYKEKGQRNHADQRLPASALLPLEVQHRLVSYHASVHSARSAPHSDCYHGFSARRIRGRRRLLWYQRSTFVGRRQVLRRPTSGDSWPSVVDCNSDAPAAEREERRRQPVSTSLQVSLYVNTDPLPGQR